MLTLPIKRKWFEMIVNREKLEEYRSFTPYYTTRFFNALCKDTNISKDAFIDSVFNNEFQDKVFYLLLRNGYNSNSPTVMVSVTLSYGSGEKEWGWEEDCYILHIQEVFSQYICAIGKEDDKEHYGWLINYDSSSCYIINDTSDEIICNYNAKETL